MTKPTSASASAARGDQINQIGVYGGELVSRLEDALASLDTATAIIEQLRALGDAAFTVDLEGLDTLHWIADATQATRSALATTRYIATSNGAPTGWQHS